MSIEITPEFLAELKDKAEDATPGPWICNSDNWVTNPEYEYVVRDSVPDDARYIAAVNPQVVLALLDEIESLNTEVAVLEREKSAYYKAFDKLAEKLGVFKETDPGKPETFEVFARIFEQLEKEAGWLAILHNSVQERLVMAACMALP